MFNAFVLSIIPAGIRHPTGYSCVASTRTNSIRIDLQKQYSVQVLATFCHVFSVELTVNY